LEENATIERKEHFEKEERWPRRLGDSLVNQKVKKEIAKKEKRREGNATKESGKSLLRRKGDM